MLKAKASDSVFNGGVLRGIRTEDGVVEVEAAVVAAGACSKPFATALGDKVTLDTERGYHIVIRKPEVVPSRAIMDAAGKFVAAPMEDGLRLAGTVEFAGLEALRIGGLRKSWANSDAGCSPDFWRSILKSEYRSGWVFDPACQTLFRSSGCPAVPLMLSTLSAMAT